MLSMGLIGCQRAKLFLEVVQKGNLPIDVKCVLDVDEMVLKDFSNLYPNIFTLSDRYEFFASEEFEAVYIASPVAYHFDHCRLALKNEKHVLCEVPIIQEIAQGYELIELSNATGLVCMMAENYCFLPNVLALNSAFKKGAFGEITFIRSGYIHDCKHLNFDYKKGSLTWRGELKKITSGNDYPTHALGPVCKLLGIGSGLDHLKSITTYSSKEAAMSDFAKNPSSPMSNLPDGFFRRGDISASFIETYNGILIELNLDTVSNRPSSMADLYIQGSRGAFISGRYDKEKPIYSETNSHDHNVTEFEIFNFKDFLTNQENGEVERLDRLFPFYKVIEDFMLTVKGIKRPYITNYDGILWSAVIELSQKSILAGSSKEDFPSKLTGWAT